MWKNCGGELQQVLHHYNEDHQRQIHRTESLQIKDEQSAREIDTHKKHIQKCRSAQRSIFPILPIVFLYRVDDFIAIYYVFGHLQESISALRCQLSSGVTAQHFIQAVRSSHRKFNSFIVPAR